LSLIELFWILYLVHVENLLDFRLKLETEQKSKNLKTHIKFLILKAIFIYIQYIRKNKKIIDLCHRKSIIMTSLEIQNNFKDFLKFIRCNYLFGKNQKNFVVTILDIEKTSITQYDCRSR